MTSTHHTHKATGPNASSPKDSKKEHGNSNGKTGERRSSASSTASVEKSSRSNGATPKPEKYVVIVTNVENEFGLLHNAAVPVCYGLPPALHDTDSIDRILRNGGSAVNQLVCATQGCSYTVHCRTETRSAEISLYGPADADFMPLLTSRRSRHQMESKPTASVSTAEEEDASAPEATSSPDDTNATTTSAVMAESTEATVSGPVALALRLKRLPYFENHLPVHVYLPEREAGTVLLQREYPQPASTVTDTDAVGKKRSRGQEKDEGKTTQKTRRTADSDGDEKLKKKKDDGAVQQQEAERKEWEEASKPRVTTVHQFPSRQKNLVSAVGVLSHAAALHVVRRRLHDLPGYLSAWTLYEKHLRVVFDSAEALFKAKEVLDQLPLEPGLRMSLTLSGSLARAMDVFVRAEEAAKEAMG